MPASTSTGNMGTLIEFQHVKHTCYLLAHSLNNEWTLSLDISNPWHVLTSWLSLSSLSPKKPKVKSQKPIDQVTSSTRSAVSGLVGSASSHTHTDRGPNACGLSSPGPIGILPVSIKRPPSPSVGSCLLQPSAFFLLLLMLPFFTTYSKYLHSNWWRPS